MTFTSFEFLLYFPVAVLLYNTVPHRFRIWYLLVVSYAFYAMMQPVYLVLLAGVTGMTYGFARWIAKTDDDIKRSRIMVCSIICVLLPLFFFKYYNFVNEQIASLIGVEVLMPKMGWLLPVGISFYTFMAIGYLVDVNNDDVEVEKNIGIVGAFLSFFPIVLSGPIERPGNMFPQFKNLKRSKPEDLTSGAKMMLWGYFMKLCVADRLGLYVDAVFGNVIHHNGTTLLFASLLNPIRLYADFAGYSMLAMGISRCLGIKIIENFHRPFFATSMSELWHRWHISLIKWLTDYIYTPLNFVFRGWKKWGMVVAIMVTFFASGVWHGAAWTYIVWGLMQGFFLSVEVFTKNKRTDIETKYKLVGRWWYTAVCCCIVFFLFAFSQIFGYCTDLYEAGEVVRKIFVDKGPVFSDKDNLSYGMLFLAVLFVVDSLHEFLPNDRKILFNSKNSIIRYISYILVVTSIILMGVLDGGSFIYFQF